MSKSLWVVAWGMAVFTAGGCDAVEKLGEASKEAADEAATPDVGSACKTADGVYCKNKTTLLECVDSKWTAIPCRGEKGCSGTAVVSCDHTIANVGDACGDDENHSCSEDHKAQLKCEKHKWVEIAQCRGPKACETKFPFSKCDQSIVKEGDACEKEENAACSEDKKAIMLCKAKKYAVGEKCTGECVSEGLFVKCK
jgi:hypothetical protein